MELELKDIERRLTLDLGIIQKTIGTKLDLNNAKMVAEYNNWKKF